MRLIDADKLEDVLAKHQTHYYGDSDYYEGISQGFNLAIYDVKETPTIDAVEVVRCKDCRWFDKTEDSSYGYCHAMKHTYLSKNWEISIYRTYKEDFYCADGEKKEVKG